MPGIPSRWRRRHQHVRVAPDLLHDRLEPLFLALGALRGAFHDALKIAGIKRTTDSRIRLHDLRHSFAGLRLLLWCEQNVDLGAKLPLLAAYLGHVGLASSQRYLQLTRDLMGEITRRHQARFGYLIREESR